MVTLVGIVIAIAPFAAVLGLLAWAARRDRRRAELRARQIALTETIHERLGAVAAPVVRRRRRGWQVCLAVPCERPAVTEALLTVVREAFAPCRSERPLEIVVTRQPESRSTTPVGGSGVRREPVSWT